MADIELVIKIPKDTYTDIIESGYIEHGYIWDEDKEEAIRAIKNGTPIPKGHGDLIDKSKIYKAIPAEEDNCTGMGMTLEEMDAYNEGIDSMYLVVQGGKPIVEADKEE